MTSKRWQDIYADKLVSPREALSNIRNGQTIFIGTGCGEPLLLTGTLTEMAEQFSDIKVIHLMAQGDQRFASPELRSSFRYNTFYIGRGVEAAVAEGTADYTPINMSELPRIVRKGIVIVDVALVQVTVPDSSGMCSLGVSVDAVKVAVENAKLVIAQVNENMPVTMGDTRISMDNIHYMVEGNAPLIEVPSPQLDPVSLTIGRLIANLITNGMALHFDRGVISAATMRYLDSKKDLGIHTDILTDDLLRLIKTGAVTNLKKKINKGKTVATMALGSRELYEAVDNNPAIELYPIDYVNSPYIISKNDNMTSILSIQEIELSGLASLAKVDTKSVNIHSFPSSTDFIDGSRRSKHGLVIMALPSTTADGEHSRIVAESIGRGVYYNRAIVDIVVTEYGYVNLYGRSIRERAIALISIAHPKFRKQLLKDAKRFNYVDENQIISPESGCVYPHHYEFHYTFADGLKVFFRPVKPLDAKGLQRMFYTLSEESVRMRYHGTIKTLSNEVAQKLANIDYCQDMAIIGLNGPPANRKIIAEARYTYNPTNNMGEFDTLVAEDFRGHGIGLFLANYLKKIAYSRGLSGLYCDIIQQNAGTIALIGKAWPTAERHFDSGICTIVVRFPEEDVRRPKDSIIVYSGRFNDYSYGEGHPFRSARAQSTMRLIREEGFLNEPWIRVEEPKKIPKERLFQSHEPAFIEALERANSGEWDEEFLQFHLGGDDCPVFPGLFDYVLLYTSATLTGVDLIINENANVVFNPMGGFHHAHRGFAEGFCYVNDVIVAIDTFLAQGLRVAYIDIDAHHGNGVQDAYYQDDRVLTISLHQTGKTLYPWSGFETEIGKGIGEGFNINVPLPPETDDEAFGMVFDRLITKTVRLFRPNVVVAVAGADTHKNDPLTNLSITNNGMVEAIERIRNYSNHLLLLGGGGYDITSTSRAWCRMWAAANRISSMPDYLLTVGGTFLGSEDLRGAGIVDRAYLISGERKREILRELDRIIQYHEEHTIPIIQERNKGGVGL